MVGWTNRIAVTALVLMGAAALMLIGLVERAEAQELSLVEVYEDNTSPETDGSPIVLTHLDGPTANSPGVIVSPDGAHVYVTSNLDDAIMVLSRDGIIGTLTLVEIHADNGSPEAGGSPTVQTHLDGAAAIAISPDGNHLYVTAVDDDALTVFSRDSGTGVLTLVEVHDDDGALEPGGSPIEQTHFDSPAGVTVSPDGSHVYVTSFVDEALTVFSRDSGSGALTLVEVHDDNESPETDGSPIEQTHLDGAEYVAVSPDGNHVLVGCRFDDAVTVFSRDSGTGALTLVEIHADDRSLEMAGSPIEQTHIDFVRDIAFSPDGSFVYVLGTLDDAVTVFARDSGTGALTLLEVHADNGSFEAGGNPVVQTHLSRPRSLAVTADRVLITGAGDDAVTVFSRSAVTGLLSLLEIHADSESPEASGSPIVQTHLDSVASITFEPGLTYVYVTSLADDAITVLGPTALGLGDVVFTLYHADNPREFSFLLLVPVVADTTLTFTDAGWLAAGGFRAGEGAITWTAGDDLPKNTQVTIDFLGLTASNDAGLPAGTVTAISGTFLLSTNGDQILAYQGVAPTAGDTSNFVTAIQMNAAWDSDATSDSTSAQPSVFTDGVNSISITPEFDNAFYNCDTVDGTPAELRAAITDSSHWTRSNTRLTPPGCMHTPVELQSFSVD